MKIREIADAYLDRLASTDPTAEAALGRTPTSWLPRLSPEAYEDRMDAARIARGALSVVDLAGAREEDRDLAAALSERLDAEILLWENGFTPRLLAPLATGVHQIREVFDSLPRSTPEDWHELIRHLHDVPAALNDLSRTQLRAAIHQHIVAERQILAVGQQIRGWIAPGGYFTSLAASAPAQLREDVQRAAEVALGGYSDYLTFLDGQLLPRSETAQVPDAVGSELYAATSAAFLGAQRDPLELAEWGWAELDRIDAEIEQLSRKLHPDGRAAAIAQLDADPARRVETDAVVPWLEQTVDRIADHLGAYVELPAAAPRPRVAMSTSGSGVMYYEPGDPELIRPGTVWWATESGRPLATWRELTTVHHEGLPGHHLQIATALSAQALHPWQRSLCHIHGYAEGWAHYAEQWAADIGLLDDPGDRLGMLLGQAWRAARIVIDTGLHLNLAIPSRRIDGVDRWTFESAIQFLQQVSGLGPRMARFEVERYLGWPAQALAFRVGAKLFGEIADAARARPGFDSRQFHHSMLRRGPMGLDPLRRRLLADG